MGAHQTQKKSKVATKQKYAHTRTHAHTHARTPFPMQQACFVRVSWRQSCPHSHTCARATRIRLHPSHIQAGDSPGCSADTERGKRERERERRMCVNVCLRVWMPACVSVCVSMFCAGFPLLHHHTHMYPTSNLFPPLSLPSFSPTYTLANLLPHVALSSVRPQFLCQVDIPNHRAAVQQGPVKLSIGRLLLLLLLLLLAGHVLIQAVHQPATRPSPRLQVAPHGLCC